MNTINIREFKIWLQDNDIKELYDTETDVVLNDIFISFIPNVICFRNKFVGNICIERVDKIIVYASQDRTTFFIHTKDRKKFSIYARGKGI